MVIDDVIIYLLYHVTLRTLHLHDILKQLMLIKLKKNHLHAHTDGSFEVPPTPQLLEPTLYMSY